MKPKGDAEYCFEYSKGEVMIRVLLLAIVTFAVFIVSSFFLIKYIGLWSCIFFSVGVPSLIVYINRKNFKSFGVATLSQDKLSIHLDNSQRSFLFQDINSYKVEYFSGVSLSLHLNNRTKFRLFANNSCNTTQLERLCNDFEKVIGDFKLSTTSPLRREKSILEKQWFFILLIVMTGAGTFGLVHSFLFGIGEGKASTAFVVFVPLITLWIGYFTNKTKRKLT